MRTPPVFKVTLSDIREKDEYEAEAQKIKDVYLEEKSKPKTLSKKERAQVGPEPSMREKILRLSLFPNIFVKSGPHRTFEAIEASAESDYTRKVKKDQVPQD
jgi:hypothetical protein